jgi:uncharacterized protein involved in outer membrane biogenesis
MDGDGRLRQHAGMSDSMPPPPPPPPGPQAAPGQARRRRPGRWAVAAIAAGGLLSLYLLFSWLAFEPTLRWALNRFAAGHGGHQLSFGEARFDPWRLAAEVKGLDLRDPAGRPLAAVQGLVVDLDAGSPFRLAFVFDRVEMTQPVVHVEWGADGRLNWQGLLDSLAGPTTEAPAPDEAPARWWLRQLVVRQGQLALADRRAGRDAAYQVAPVDLDVSDLSSLAEHRGQHRLAASLTGGATLQWTGALTLNPLAASGELALQGLPADALWPYLKPLLAIAPPRGTASLSLSYRLADEGASPSLTLDQVRATLQGLALQGPEATEPALALERIELSGGRLDLARHELTIDAVRIGPGRLRAARDDAGRVDLQSWVRPAAAAPAASASAPQGAASGASGSGDAPWRLAVAQVDVKGLALQLADRSFSAPLTAQVGELQVGFGLQASAGGDASALTVERLAAGLDGLRVSSAGIAQPWFELASLKLSDGRLSTAERQLTLGGITLGGGRLRAERDAGGGVALLQALQPAQAARPVAPGSAETSQPAWRYRIDRVQATDFGVTVREASVDPPAEFVVQDLTAEAEGLSQDLAQAVPVKLALALQSGGRLSLQGRVVPGRPSAELEVALDDLALSPAQPYVARASTLALVDGSAGSRGRLQWHPERWRYDGALSFGPLRIDEAESGDRFLSWKRLSSPAFSVTPQGLHIGQLRADGLGAKLVIFKDRTLNAAKIVKPSAAPEASAPSAGPPFAVDIDRVQVVGGTLDFADLSLALPFGARITDLAGQLVGLSRSGTAPAQLELAGKVDEYGLARATGELRLFDPSAFTDVKVEFRNVEMTSLTPYSATFAGRKIESGKLSLDLEYKVDQRRLTGDNQVVMDKLTLGDRVDSPDAADLPLDLAIALLQDGNGRIDLGLPVSGSLDDPQFSYGQIVWKAIVNLLTKIVTAPFRALGALLGGGDQPLDQVGFDLGRAALLPPEREKLARLSQALARRPALALTVQGGFDPEGDAAALRELALRRAVAERTGHPAPQGEEPGPIGLAEPATREALDALFAQRFGAPELARLKQGAGPAQAAASAASGAAPAAADLTAVYRRVAQQLRDAQAVTDAQLQALGEARAQAVHADLLARGVAPNRLKLQPPQARPAEKKTVTTVLGLEPAAVPAGAASVPAATASAAAAR